MLITILFIIHQQLAWTQAFPDITLVPLQQYQEITTFENILKIEGCQEQQFDAWIDYGEQDKNLTIDSKYKNINLISTSTIQVLIGNSLSYCFGALYDDTQLIFMRDNPYFFNPQYSRFAVKYDLLDFYKTKNLDPYLKCDHLHKTSDQQQFYALCKEIDLSYRMFVEININEYCNQTDEHPQISFNRSILTDTKQDQEYQIISQSINNDKYIILYNKETVLTYYCGEDQCQKINEYNGTDLITDIKPLYSNSEYWKVAILYQNQSLYLATIYQNKSEFNQSQVFLSYQYDRYRQLSVYKTTNWQGNQPSFIYPEIVLLTTNFIYLFNVISISDHLDLQLVGQIQFNNSFDQQLRLVQDDTYIYIHMEVNKSNSILYINKQKLIINELLNNFISNNIMYITYDLIQELSYFDNKFIVIYYFDEQFRGRQVNIVNKLLIINANDFKDTQNQCTIIFNNNHKLTIELIQQNSKRILVKQNSTYESDTLQIKLDLNELFRGQLLEYSSKPQSKRLQFPNKILDTQQILQSTITLDQPQTRDNYTVISSQYSHIDDIVFTLYQFPNKSLALFKSFTKIYDSNIRNVQKGLLQNFDQIEDRLIFSIGSFDQKNISTYIIDWSKNNTEDQIIYLNDYKLQSYGFQEISEEKILYCKQISQCFQKIIYFLIRTVSQKLFLIYFKYDELERNCVQFHNYIFDDIDLTLSLYNIFVAKANSTQVEDAKYELVYFRLPITENKKNDSCFNIYPNKLVLNQNFNYSDSFDFKLLDLRFIDGYKPPALVFIDIEYNNISLHYLRNLDNFGIFSQVTPLPLILPGNITLKDQRISYFIKSGTKFSQDFSLKIFQRDDKSLQQILLYNLVEQSGNQVYIIFNNASEKDDLFILPKAYQSNSLQDLTQYVRYVQGTIDPNQTKTQFNNIRYYYKFSPQFLMDIAGYKELNKQIFNIDFQANNSLTDRKNSSAKIKFQLNGSTVIVTDLEPIKVNSSTIVELKNYQGSIEIAQIKNRKKDTFDPKNLTFLKFTESRQYEQSSKWFIDKDFIFRYTPRQNKEIKPLDIINNITNITKFSYCKCFQISYYAVISQELQFVFFDESSQIYISNNTYDVQLICLEYLKTIHIISLQYVTFSQNTFSSQMVIHKFDKNNIVTQIQNISSNTSNISSPDKDKQFQDLEFYLDMRTLCYFVYLKLNTELIKIIVNIKDLNNYKIVKLEYPEYYQNDFKFQMVPSSIQLFTNNSTQFYQVLNIRQCKPLAIRPIITQAYLIGFADCNGLLEINFYFYNQSFTKQIEKTLLKTSQLQYQFDESRLRLFQNEIVLEYSITCPLKYGQILEHNQLEDDNQEYQQCVYSNETLYFTCIELTILNENYDNTTLI
ncbi:hypothetical protein pb186bvf_020055, partial [Paramecium bursaria]